MNYQMGWILGLGQLKFLLGLGKKVTDLKEFRSGWERGQGQIVNIRVLKTTIYYFVL